MNELISQYNSELKETDPELVEILNNFLENEVLKNSTLDKRRRLLVTLATLIANQSLNLYSEFVKIALAEGVTPIEIKEVLYHSLSYVGLSKTYDFIDETNNVFDEKGIDLPLPGQSTVNKQKRREIGYNLQTRNFGKEFIDNSIENTPDEQKHIWDFISAYAYGDFYTRTGLNDQDRELISFTLILSLRGCEDQLYTHVRGNFSVGNSKETLVSVITVLVMYIGFPRVHNALNVVNKVYDERI